jgi:hypothetical protein
VTKRLNIGGPIIVTALLTCALGACVDVNGGAVELSWSIRTVEGTQSDCGSDNANIGSVSLCVRSCDVQVAGICMHMTDTGPVDDTVCPESTWSCSRLHGDTHFDIAPGPKELWITAGCDDGSAARVTVPESIVRDVVEGEVTELNALLITWEPSAGKACP